MARKMRILEKSLEFGDYRLILCTYNREAKVLEVLKNQYDIVMQHPGLAEGFVVEDRSDIVIALRNGFGIPELIHELEHATFKMLNRCAISHSEETDETFAMQIDSLYRIVIQMLKEDKYKLPEL